MWLSRWPASTKRPLRFPALGKGTQTPLIIWKSPYRWCRPDSLGSVPLFGGGTPDLHGIGIDDIIREQINLFWVGKCRENVMQISRFLSQVRSLLKIRCNIDEGCPAHFAL